MWGRKRVLAELHEHGMRCAVEMDQLAPTSWLTFGVELKTAVIRREVRTTDELDTIFEPLLMMPAPKQRLLGEVWHPWSAVEGPDRLDTALVAHVNDLATRMANAT